MSVRWFSSEVAIFPRPPSDHSAFCNWHFIYLLQWLMHLGTHFMRAEKVTGICCRATRLPVTSANMKEVTFAEQESHKGSKPAPRPQPSSSERRYWQVEKRWNLFLQNYNNFWRFLGALSLLLIPFVLFSPHNIFVAKTVAKDFIACASQILLDQKMCHFD